MLGIFGVIVIDAKKISDYLKENVQINVFLHDRFSDAEMKSFQDELARQQFAKSVIFISKEQALDSLKKELGENVQVAQVDITNEQAITDFITKGAKILLTGKSFQLKTGELLNNKIFPPLIEYSLKKLLSSSRVIIDFPLPDGLIL